MNHYVLCFYDYFSSKLFPFSICSNSYFTSGSFLRIKLALNVKLFAVDYAWECLETEILQQTHFSSSKILNYTIRSSSHEALATSKLNFLYAAEAPNKIDTVQSKPLLCRVLAIYLEREGHTKIARHTDYCPRHNGIVLR